MYTDCGQYGDLNLQAASEGICKDIKDWDGHDCLDWAYKAHSKLNIPISSWVSVDGFKYLTGRELLRHNLEDFCRLVDDEHGPRFFQLFKVEQRQEDAECFLSHPQLMENNSISNSSSWLAPNSFLTQPSLCVSPSPGSPHLLEYEHSYTNLGAYATSPAQNSSFQDYHCNGYSTPMAETLDFPNQLDPQASTFNDSDKGLHFDMDGLLNLSEGQELDLLEEDISGLDDYIHAPDEHSQSFERLIEGTNHLHLEQPGTQASGFQLHPEVANNLIVNVSNNELGEEMLKKVSTGKRKNRSRNPRSWEFLIRLLIHPSTNPSLVKWEDKETGTFRFVKKEEIARLWGSRTDRHRSTPLSYENFARNLRHNYKTGLLHAVSEKHLVYRLGEKILDHLRQERLI